MGIRETLSIFYICSFTYSNVEYIMQTVTEQTQDRLRGMQNRASGIWVEKERIFRSRQHTDRQTDRETKIKTSRIKRGSSNKRFCNLSN